jgi:lipoprotein signal peptidase
MTTTSTPPAAELPAAVASAPRAHERPSHALVARRFLIVGALVLADLWSKAAVFQWMQGLEAERALPFAPGLSRPCYPLAGDWLSFMLTLNPGAAFGQFDDIPYLLVGGRIAAGLFLTWLVWRSRPGRPVFNTALLLVLAGALGNLYDNLLRTRNLVLDAEYMHRPFMPVRDFIDVYFSVWNWHFPTFNVADSCITVGAILLLACGLFTRDEDEPRAA